jgi:CRP/FNR family transcriptional regulator
MIDMDTPERSQCSSADLADCRESGGSIFTQLKQSDVELLFSAGHCYEYEHGELIFRAGDEPTHLYCILNGKVEIFRIGHVGREQAIRLVGTGAIFGYRSLLSGENHRSSSKAIEHSRICHIPKESFFALLENNPVFAIRLMALLSSDLRAAEERIVDLAQRPVHERVAEVLLRLRETYGLEEDQATINISMTRKELASVAGIAMETMSRQLQRFRQEGIVDLVGHKITILNSRALVKAANLDY